jgi:uncharacterized membrane protein YjgN (DUF898 family)
MKYKIEIKWALIFSLFSLLWILGEKVAGFHDPNRNLTLQPFVTMLILIPNLLIYYWALKEKKTKYFGGRMNFAQGFKTGIFITGVITILTPLVQYIISTIITPDYFENVIQYLVSHNEMTLEDARAQFNLKNYMITSTVFGAIFGIITSAIMAFLLKNKAQNGR